MISGWNSRHFHVYKCLRQRRSSPLALLLLFILQLGAIRVNGLTIGSENGKSGNSVTVSCPDAVEFGRRLWLAGPPLVDPAAPPGTPAPDPNYSFTVGASAGSGWRADAYPTSFTQSFSAGTGDASLVSVTFHKIKHLPDGTEVTEGEEKISVRAYVPKVVFGLNGDGKVVRGVPQKPEPELPPSVGLRQNTQLLVTYTPTLGNNPITFSVTNAGDNQAGEVTLPRSGKPDGAGNLMLTGTVGTTYDLHQDDPGYYAKRKLVVIAKLGNKIVARSEPFAVCAHPTGIKFTSGSSYSTSSFWGAFYTGELISSSGVLSECRPISTKEFITDVRFASPFGGQLNAGVWGQGTGIPDQIGLGNTNAKALQRQIEKAGNAGYRDTHQYSRYACPLCGIPKDDGASFLIFNSGFAHHLTAFKDSGGAYYITVQKVGEPNNGVGAGACDVSSVISTQVQ